MTMDADTGSIGASAFQQLATVRIHLLATLTAKHAESHYRRYFDLRLLEARTVLLLGGLRPMTLKTVCREANIEKAYASRMVDRLIGKGLVHKTTNPADQRSVQLQLTSKGRELYEALYAETAARNERWLSVLPEQERQVFMRCLDRLTRAARGALAEERSAREMGTGEGS